MHASPGRLSLIGPCRLPGPPSLAVQGGSSHLKPGRRATLRSWRDPPGDRCQGAAAPGPAGQRPLHFAGSRPSSQVCSTKGLHKKKLHHRSPLCSPTSPTTERPREDKPVVRGVPKALQSPPWQMAGRPGAPCSAKPCDSHRGNQGHPAGLPPPPLPFKSPCPSSCPPTPAHRACLEPRALLLLGLWWPRPWVLSPSLWPPRPAWVGPTVSQGWTRTPSPSQQSSSEPPTRSENLGKTSWNNVPWTQQNRGRQGRERSVGGWQERAERYSLWSKN